MKFQSHIILFLFLLTTTITNAQWDDPGFFPRAAWLQSTFRAQEYKDAGMNMYIALWNPLDETQLTDLTNAGMYLITKQSDFALENINDTTIIAWKQNKSEPDNAQWNSGTNSYDPCIDPALLIADYHTIKENDPDRPVFIGLGRGVSDIDWIGRGTCTGNYEMYREETNGYIAGGDIVSFDIYPVNDVSPLTSENLWYVPKGIDSLKAWASTPKTFFAWIETTKFDASSNRAPTPAEVKSEVWMAIIHGARGIGYFCHRLSPNFDEAALLHDEVMIDSVAAINQMIDNLAPIINSPDTDFSEVISSNVDVPIDIMTKFYENDNYIFAVAMRPGMTTGSFVVPVGSTIEVVGENRTVTESNGIFSDAFSDYGVHIYKISSVVPVNEVSARFDNFTVFPNPTTGQLKLSFLEKIEATVTVLSVSGEILFQETLQGHQTDMDLSHLPNGVYWVSVRTEEKSVHARVVLQK